MKFGFTGTQDGMTIKQAVEVKKLLAEAAKFPGFEFHHGDCVGADAEAHRAAREVGAHVVIHPPVKDSKRAFCKGDLVLPAKDYLARNKDIVDAADMLIAAPKGPEELRSGTWSTVRYAKKTEVMTVIIMPSGEVIL